MTVAAPICVPNSVKNRCFSGALPSYYESGMSSARVIVLRRRHEIGLQGGDLVFGRHIAEIDLFQSSERQDCRHESAWLERVYETLDERDHQSWNLGRVSVALDDIAVVDWLFDTTFLEHQRVLLRRHRQPGDESGSSVVYRRSNSFRRDQMAYDSQRGMHLFQDIVQRQSGSFPGVERSKLDSGLFQGRKQPHYAFCVDVALDEEEGLLSIDSKLATNWPGLTDRSWKLVREVARALKVHESQSIEYSQLVEFLMVLDYGRVPDRDDGQTEADGVSNFKKHVEV